MRPKHEIVLRAMQQGMEVEFPDGFTYAMIDNKICVNLQCYEEGQPTEIQWSTSDMSLNCFIAQCHRIEEDKIALMCANLALNSLYSNR